MEEPKIIEVGKLKKGKHQQDAVQHENGLCRCICTGHHASTPHLLKTLVSEPKIIKEGNYSPSGHNASSVVNINGISPIVMEEPQVMTPKRTEFGKQVRKDYESGNLSISRHDMTTMEPRTDGVSNTLTSVQKDNFLCIPEATKKGYAETYEGDSVNIGFPSSKTRRGKVGHQMCNTLDTGCQQGVVTNYRIRKLTPRECFRLMGVDDKDIETLLNAGLSNTRLYALAGNSIVVDNLCHILRTMFVDKPTKQVKQLTLF